MSLATLHKLIVAIGVALGVTATGALSGVTWHPGLVLMTKLLVVAGSAWIASHLADLVVADGRVRRKLAGRTWIDGTWLNVVRDEKGRALSVGIVMLVPDGAGIRYEGRNYDPVSGELDGSFATKACTIDFPQLHFVYSSVSRRGRGLHAVGGGLLQFVSTDDGSPAQRFTAWCDGAIEGSPHTIEGVRICSDEDLVRLRTGDGRAAVALATERRITSSGVVSATSPVGAPSN